jgi:hypothetical protein
VGGGHAPQVSPRFAVIVNSPDLLFFRHTDPRGVYTTQPDTPMVNIKYNFDRFFNDIMRCFHPVWRLNLIAINLKKIHQNELIRILYRKPLNYTRIFSWFKRFGIQSSHKLFGIQSFQTRHKTEKIYYRIQSSRVWMATCRGGSRIFRTLVKIIWRHRWPKSDDVIWRQDDSPIFVGV